MKNSTHAFFNLGLAAALIATGTLLPSCSKNEVEPTKGEAVAKRDENIVTLTKANLEHVAIKTEPASIGSLENTIKASARISENLNKTAKVASTFEGRLTKLNCDINDHVKAGDVLGLVQAPELLGKPLELKSPINGVVIERKSTVGELVDKTSEIYTISDPNNLWVVAEVKERDLAALKIGQKAFFKVLAYPGEEFHGQVIRLGNQVEKDSRTLEARIETSNEDLRLKPGMFADVEIVTTILNDVLLIPDSALQTDGEEQIVFVALDSLKFEKRVVKLGLEQSGLVQILNGVKTGEKVVTEGSFILKSEMLKGQLGED